MVILAVVLLGIGVLFVRMIVRDVQREERRRKRLASASRRPRILPQHPRSARPAPLATSTPLAVPDGAAGSLSRCFVTESRAWSSSSRAAGSSAYRMTIR